MTYQGWRNTLLVVGLMGCGETRDERVGRCFARNPTIQTGIYGCVTYTDDVGDHEPQAVTDFAVQLFLEQPPPTPGDGLVPFAEVRSDKVGYFELALAPRSYWVCTTFRRCANIEVAASSPRLCDYEMGQGVNWDRSYDRPE